MAEPIDFQKHRQTIRAELAFVNTQLESTRASNEVCLKLIQLVNSLVDSLEEQQTAFEKFILAAARASNDYDEFKERCRELEEDAA